MKHLNVVILLLIIILCYKCLYKKEKYDTREGLFASLITERQRSDGTKARQGLHFTGTKDPSGRITIQPTNQGVINTSHLKFLDTFYDGVNEPRILSYAKDPNSYPSKSVMDKLSETSLEEIEAELATAQQEATNAKKRVEDITSELTANRQNLVPINSENASSLKKIEQLKTQLSTAQQQAQEAEQKYQSELNKTKTASGVSVFTDMFEKVSTPPPPPPPDPNVSQNGRCGWNQNVPGAGRKCPPGQCCSSHGWCGGSSNSTGYSVHGPNRDSYCRNKKFGMNAYFRSTLRARYERGEIDSFLQGTSDGQYDGDPIPFRSTIPEDEPEWDGFETFVG